MDAILKNRTEIRVGALSAGDTFLYEDQVFVMACQEPSLHPSNAVQAFIEENRDEGEITVYNLTNNIIEIMAPSLKAELIHMTLVENFNTNT